MCFLQDAGCVDSTVEYVVTLSDVSGNNCLACGGELNDTQFTGKFVGHEVLDNGVFDKFMFTEPMVCPHCGQPRAGALMLCIPAMSPDMKALFGI